MHFVSFSISSKKHCTLLSGSSNVNSVPSAAPATKNTININDTMGSAILCPNHVICTWATAYFARIRDHLFSVYFYPPTCLNHVTCTWVAQNLRGHGPVYSPIYSVYSFKIACIFRILSIYSPCLCKASRMFSVYFFKKIERERRFPRSR